jgi:hypothetical protein
MSFGRRLVGRAFSVANQSFDVLCYCRCSAKVAQVCSVSTCRCVAEMSENGLALGYACMRGAARGDGDCRRIFDGIL